GRLDDQFLLIRKNKLAGEKHLLFSGQRFLFFFLLDADDVQLVQLLGVHEGGSAHHHVLGVFVHGEGDDLTDGVLTSQQHHHAVHTGGNACVGGSAVGEGVVHGGE